MSVEGVVRLATIAILTHSPSRDRVSSTMPNIVSIILYCPAACVSVASLRLQHLADRTAGWMIGYWHHNVARLFVLCIVALGVDAGQ